MKKVNQMASHWQKHRLWLIHLLFPLPLLDFSVRILPLISNKIIELGKKFVWFFLLPLMKKWEQIYWPTHYFEKILLQCSSVYFRHSVVFDSLQLHESQHARPPCPSPTPGVHSDSHPSSQWCHPAISSSVIPFSSCPQSSIKSFPMSQLFARGGQSTGVSALASFLPKKSQGWSHYTIIRLYWRPLIAVLLLFNKMLAAIVKKMDTHTLNLNKNFRKMHMVARSQLLKEWLEGRDWRKL